MIPDDLKAISDEELLALKEQSVFAGDSTLTGRESERVWLEIVRPAGSQKGAYLRSAGRGCKGETCRTAQGL